MNNLILSATILALLSLTACDKPTVVNVPAETIVVPVPGPAGATGEKGNSGDEGIQGKPGVTGDEGIQGEPGKSGGDTTIIIPPPVVDMPPEVVPEPSAVTPAN